jgi:hypothetical protein
LQLIGTWVLVLWLERVNVSGHLTVLHFDAYDPRSSLGTNNIIIPSNKVVSSPLPSMEVSQFRESRLVTFNVPAFESVINLVEIRPVVRLLRMTTVDVANYFNFTFFVPYLVLWFLRVVWKLLHILHWLRDVIIDLVMQELSVEGLTLWLCAFDVTYVERVSGHYLLCLAWLGPVNVRVVYIVPDESGYWWGHERHSLQLIVWVERVA